VTTSSKLHPKFQSGVVVISGLWGLGKSALASPQNDPDRPPSLLAHLLLGIYEDEAGNKLLQIAGMRSSNGQVAMNPNIPIEVDKETGTIDEPASHTYLL
jgi:hypothetical protein